MGIAEIDAHRLDCSLFGQKSNAVLSEDWMQSPE
jgi:hypothetical protein